MINDPHLKAFNAYNVEIHGAAAHGVYALYDSLGAVTYYGRASGLGVTIKSRLKDHLSGREGRCTQSASYFKQERSQRASERERELLEEHARAYGRLPKCNDRVG